MKHYFTLQLLIMISLIMLSWERVDRLIQNINCYSSYNLIDEIIVFNNNPKYKLDGIQNQKVILIESSRDLGLYTRFAAAGLARNNCILHCDDDLLVPEDTISILYQNWTSTPSLCHGTQGRIVDDCYNMKPVYGDVHIVLTRCMLVSKSNCLAAFELSDKFKDLYCEPKGNGEDIILSFMSISNSGKLNKSYNLPYSDHFEINSRENLSTAISKRWEHHVDHRSRVVNRCRQLLGSSIDINPPIAPDSLNC